MSFLTRGFDQVESDVKAQMDRREKMSARRVWMKANASTQVVFLDEEPVRFEEYRIFKDKRPEFITKPVPPQRDRFLAAGYKSDERYAFSVIDCTKWKDGKGQEHQFEKRLLVVAADTAKLLRDKKSSWGGLKHKAVIIRRKGERDASYGSDFELMMKNGQVVQVKMSAFKDIAPFDYEKVLAPPSDDEAIRALAQAAQRSNNTAAVMVDDDDPGIGQELPVGEKPSISPEMQPDDLPF